MSEITQTAIGTWSGGRYLHFGEAIEEDRLAALLRPGGIDTFLTADAYGEGEGDRLLGRALEGVSRDSYSLVGAVGHDFYEGEREGPRGFPRFTDPRLRGPDQYADYLRMAAERSLERIGAERFDLLLLHNPDRTGYTSEGVWDAMAALRESGLTAQLGVAPGPANGFTLDLIDCLERFGERIDWAMIILNPFEPWPGELCLDAAARHGVKVITRVVDYGGLFWGDLRPGMELPKGDHRAFRPDGWIEVGLAEGALACQGGKLGPLVLDLAGVRTGLLDQGRHDALDRRMGEVPLAGELHRCEIGSGGNRAHALELLAPRLDPAGGTEGPVIALGQGRARG